MGVKGLWELLHPVARPIKLESLSNKRLAVDASIWLHQFMRGMRDNDGAMVGNAHIIGFFRRICKLLYYNVKPVFVFDGGTPLLKRLTIQQDKQDKQMGIEHDSTANAHYLEDTTGEPLTASVKTSETTSSSFVPAHATSQAKRIKDAYILPPMENDFETLSKIRHYDERFGHSEQDDIQTFLEAFKKEDGVHNIDSEVFQALPSEMQYEILSDIRLRSRVTSYERVQEMVRKSETPMDFSKLQVEGVIRRNTVTHKLLNVNQAISKVEEATATKPGRIASQRSRQYILVKNDDGGWALGGKKSTVGTTAEQPVRLDSDDEQPNGKDSKDIKAEDSEEWESEDDAEFEEVGISAVSPPSVDSRQPVTSIFPRKLSEDNLPHKVPVRFPQDVQKEAPLMENIEAYMSEDESVEAVMAKFAAIEDEARTRKKPEQQHKPRDDETQKDNNFLNQEEEWEEILSDGPERGSFDTLQSDTETFPDFDVNMETPDDVYGFEVPGAHSDFSTNRALSEKEECALDRDSFYGYWTGYTPDNFKIKTPDHEFLIQEAIDDWDEERLTNELHSARRKLEKTNTNDDIALESIQFWMAFLEAVLKRFKAAASEDKGDVVTNDLPPTRADSSSQPGARPSRVILLDDDDENDVDDSATTIFMDKDATIADSTEVGDFSAEPVSSTATTVDPGTLDFGSSFLKKRQDIPILLDTDKQLPTVSSPDGNKFVLVNGDEELKAVSELSTSACLEYETPDYSEETEDIRMDMGELDYDDQDQEEARDDDELDEARDVNLADEEQDISNLFPDMAVLPGALVMPKEASPQTIALSAQEQNARDQKDAKIMLEESRKLQGEIKELKDQHRKHQRDADDLSESMIAETQALLRLFGIPYIVAPMEAEAQCADLQIRGVVDGILTEDSDVFLFGGMRVFKNMFKEEKYVECYLMTDIERDLGVDRQRLVALAYLLGSDYTTGIKGIGLVTAMEILKTFSKLEMFAKWWRGEQVKLEGEEKQDSMEKDISERSLEDLEFEANDEIALEKLAKACKKVHLPSTFPDPIVAEAYTSPLVDDDEAKFQWGIPDLDGLRDFLRGSIGWDQGEVDRILLPIIRQMSKESNQTQMTLDGFFDWSVGTNVIKPPMRTNLHKSARLRKVVSRLTGQSTSGDSVKAKKGTTTAKKRKSDGSAKGKTKPKAGAGVGSGTPDMEEDDVILLSAGSENESESESVKEQEQEQELEQEESSKAKRPKVRRSTKKISKATPQTKVPEAVIAAKQQLKSKDVVTKLAARKKRQAEEQLLEASSKTARSSSPSNGVEMSIPTKDGSESSGSSSDSDDDDGLFAPSHWDVLSQRQESQRQGNQQGQQQQQQHGLQQQSYAKARYGTSLRQGTPVSPKKGHTKKSKPSADS
ncbi:DNA repair protein rad2 [Podila humilis]|nr:DNA repair protein rad2 [Podila humilis]